MTGRLAGSKSSYLRKAADEPVEWYAWSEEAFERARKENKPVLLSIGAVWCHWCHVMAHESWQDKDVARIINEKFIPIKVDRDERPELDKIYQEAVNALTGRGGWPLTVFLTPDKEPFYGGTYFPDSPRHGLPSIKEILLAVSDAYEKNRKDVMNTVKEMMKIYAPGKLSRSELKAGYVSGAVEAMKDNYDMINGGFGGAPKFPFSEALLFLLQRYETDCDVDAWNMADHTLRKMASGGVYDQAGGGFHRYSTDSGWRVPHFEKMLYDNALLLKAYLVAYQKTRSDFYRHVSHEIVDFVFRDLVREPAGFASSIDADVHGEEGSYFVWTEDEIKGMLGNRADTFIEAFNVTKNGNFEGGKNILYMTGEIDRSKFENELTILLDTRYEREMPYVDTSIITGWTSLMSTSLLKAYEILDDYRCKDHAIKTVDFILNIMYKDGKLYRMYSDVPSVDAFIEDYSCLIEALIESFAAVQDYYYIDMAERLLADCDENFLDRENGGYFYVQKSDRSPMTQDKPVMDYSVPGPNAQMARNLIKLHYYTGEGKYREKAKELLEIFLDAAKPYPLGNATYFSALDYYANPPDQIIIAAENGEGMDFIHSVNSLICKRAVILYNDNTTRMLEEFEGKVPVGGKTTAYICRQGVCMKPVSSLDELKRIYRH
ncbi:thioredoxin domain-containing protein [Methanocella sp. CWC-04]|uniref:Thioredoxin domain-containing protein n=2 Tax=Methanooceanicella nereidis TaxID=2052831 RepID=A0AAP2W5J9_9EURY|nr:thioredoxin domain-containing protein [Methanocella sp. CWC-04]